MFIRKCHGCNALKNVKRNVGSVWCADCLKKRKEMQHEKSKDYYKKRVDILRGLREKLP